MVNTIPRHIFKNTPIGSVIPFTYRDGTTFLEEFNDMRQGINEKLIPQINENLESTAKRVTEYITYADEKASETLARFEDRHANAVDEFGRQIETINNKTGQIDIQRITLTGDTPLTIDTAWPTNLPIDFVVVQDSTGGHRLILPSNVTGHVYIAPKPESESRFTLVPLGDGTWSVAQPDVMLGRGHNILEWGGADDTTGALKMLVEYLRLTGGEIYFPNIGREYSINETIPLYSGIRLTGESKSVSIGTVGDRKMFVTGTPGTRVDNVSFTNLAFAKYGSNHVEPVIDWTGVSHSNMRDVRVRQGSGRGAVVGVLLGAYSYYNEFSGVQVRDVNIGIKMRDAANGNRFLAGTTVLYSDAGFVVENSNGNLFCGASVELLDGVGFDFILGSKQNTVMGCRIEAVKIAGCRVQWDTTNPAFNNFFCGNAFYLGAGVEQYSIGTDNTVIDARMGLTFKDLEHATKRTYINAFKNTAQGSIQAGEETRVLLQSKNGDYLAEFWDNAAHISRKGVYNLSGFAKVTSSVDANVKLAIFKNGSLAMEIAEANVKAAIPFTISGSRVVEFLKDDIIELYIRSSHAGLNILSGQHVTGMQITRHA